MTSPNNERISLAQRTLVGRQPGPTLLIVGGVHGDEFESAAAIRRLIHRLEPADLTGRVVLVPVVNEPAFWRGSRTAEDGLDLARTCPGRPDGSMTERLAHGVSELIRGADYLVDLHSGGVAMRILPTAGYMLHPDPGILEIQRKMARAFDLPVVWGTSPGLEGRTLSVARDVGVPAIYCEWSGGGECDPEGVTAYVEGCLNVLATLDMLDTAPRAPEHLRHVVEDPRDQSGHLQLNYPAPFAGFFEPEASLGDRVAPGDRLGTLYDLLGDREQAIRSEQEGILLCVRVFPPVAQGDSLAAVLETTP